MTKKIKTFKAGSATAKEGFKNEAWVVNCFNNWKNNIYGDSWLKSMGYDMSEIEFIKAFRIKGHFKTDVQVQIQVTIKLKNRVDWQNLQVKLVSNKNGFNQIDKRWVDNYQKL